MQLRHLSVGFSNDAASFFSGILPFDVLHVERLFEATSTFALAFDLPWVDVVDDTYMM